MPNDPKNPSATQNPGSQKSQPFDPNKKQQKRDDESQSDSNRDDKKSGNY